jgi:hypothetical protein
MQRQQLRLSQQLLQPRPLPQLASNFRIEDDNDDDDLFNNDIFVGYRRPKITQEPVQVDEDLSDYVTTRLLIARLRAMEKFSQQKALS